MTITFTDRTYQIVHGKRPRGYGYWGFEFLQNGEQFWHTGSYSDCKKECREYAREHFDELTVTVKVLP